jgi:hypothetical protein
MDVAPEPTRTRLWRVLKEGTARPRLPDKLRVSWSTGYLELNSTRYVQDERCFAMRHMDKVRPGIGRVGSLGSTDSGPTCVSGVS